MLHPLCSRQTFQREFQDIVSLGQKQNLKVEQTTSLACLVFAVARRSPLHLGAAPSLFARQHLHTVEDVLKTEIEVR